MNISGSSFCIHSLKKAKFSIQKFHWFSLITKDFHLSVSNSQVYGKIWNPNFELQRLLHSALHQFYQILWDSKAGLWYYRTWTILFTIWGLFRQNWNYCLCIPKLIWIAKLSLPLPIVICYRWIQALIYK